jgi:hypothetical protein
MTTSTAYCLCKNLIEAIAAYGPLQEFSAYKFQKQPVFYFEADESNPPATADMPFVVLYASSADYSEPGALVREIAVGVAIEDSENESSDAAKGMYKGFETAEVFERHVYDAIDCYLQESEQNCSILDAGNSQLKAYYPYFHCVRQKRIITERT